MCPEEIESYLKDKYHLNSLLIIDCIIYCDKIRKCRNS